MIEEETISIEELENVEAVIYDKYYQQCRDDFWTFCDYWDSEFFAERSFLKEIIKAFQDISDGKINRVSISMPPRAGKSYVASLYSTWMLGNYPTESIMRNSCTQTLAEKFSYDVRDMIRDERFKKVFEGVELSKDKQSVKGWNLTNSKQVGYFCGGVGSTIIGFGASKVAILDDSIKDVEEAMSEHILEKKWDWYTGVHQSRMEIGCSEIHIATRWSNRDIIGRLLDLNQFDKVIIVPALDDNEKSFCEAVKTTSSLLNLREIMASFIFNSEYMQQPVEVEGLLYSKEELKYFDIDKISKGEGDAIAVIDVADTGTDYLCMPIGRLIGEYCYIIDVVFTQESIELTEGYVVEMLIKYGVSACRVESNSGGRLFAKRITEELRLKNSKCEITAKRTTTNKQTKMIVNSGIIKSRMKFRNDDKRSRQYKQYMRQLTTTFKDVKKNKHDDAPDGTTQLAIFMAFNETSNW